MATVELFYDFNSPYSYLAQTQLEAIAKRAGATFVLRPFVLGAVHQAAGTHSPIETPSKLRWNLLDCVVWAREYGVPFTVPKTFPFSAIKALRLAVAADELGRQRELMRPIFHAAWGEGRDIADAAVLNAVLTGAGFDAAALLARTESPEVKARLRANGDEAIARGAYGAPTFFVGEQMIVGNDRLPFVERAAKGEKLYVFPG